MAVTGSPKRGRGRPRIKEITDSQQRTLDAICEFIDEHQLPPTTKEVAKSLGMTEGGAYDLIKQLIRKGYLKRESGRARGLIVVQKPQLSQPAGIPSLVPVPLVGLVAAGSPILAEENRVGDVLVASAVVTKGKCFALKVTGESMIGAGIEDGDIVIIRQQPLAQHNDIVVALVDGNATLKRLYWRNETIELRPENPDENNVPVGPETEFHIVGKMVAHSRMESASCTDRR